MLFITLLYLTFKYAWKSTEHDEKKRTSNVRVIFTVFCLLISSYLLGPNPKIERIEMDGTRRSSIITESVFWPNGLTIDYTADRFYWADAKHHVIESAKLDGSDRRKVQ